MKKIGPKLGCKSKIYYVDTPLNSIFFKTLHWAIMTKTICWFHGFVCQFLSPMYASCTVVMIGYEFAGYLSVYILWIQWLLRVSYVRFTTTNITYSWSGLLLWQITSQVPNYSTVYSSLSVIETNCTGLIGLCAVLYMPGWLVSKVSLAVPGQVTHWWMSPCPWGSLLWCSRQLGRFLFWDHSV